MDNEKIKCVKCGHEITPHGCSCKSRTKESCRDKYDQYYTPEGIAIDMAIRLNPCPGARILDPMCGEGNLLFMLRDMYPTHELKLIGFDIDTAAIDACKHRAREGDYFGNNDMSGWQGAKYDCNMIIMNPCFHSPLLENTIKYALDVFDRGIMYIPFDKDLPFHLNPLVFNDFELHEYDKPYLQSVFDCDIKYRQGWVYWNKGKIV